MQIMAILRNSRRSVFMITLVATLLAGCASAPGGGTARPVVTIEQMSSARPAITSLGTAVPVDYELDVTNPFDHSVTLLAVEIETVGDTGGYSLSRVRHAFAQPIAAHATARIPLRAWVRPLQVTEAGRIVASVMLRGTARFDSNGTTVRTSFASRTKQ